MAEEHQLDTSDLDEMHQDVLQELGPANDVDRVVVELYEMELQAPYVSFSHGLVVVCDGEEAVEMDRRTGLNRLAVVVEFQNGPGGKGKGKAGARSKRNLSGDGADDLVRSLSVLSRVCFDRPS